MTEPNPKALEALTILVSALTGRTLTQTDMMFELESMAAKYAPPEPPPTTRMADPFFAVAMAA